MDMAATKSCGLHAAVGMALIALIPGLTQPYCGKAGLAVIHWLLLSHRGLRMSVQHKQLGLC